MSVACWLVTGHFGRYTYLLPLGLIHHLIVKLSNVRYTYPTQTIGFDSSSYCKDSMSNVQYSYPTQTIGFDSSSYCKGSLSNVRYSYPTQIIGFDSSSYCKGSLSSVQSSYPTQTKCNLAYLAQIYNLDCRLSNIE